MRHVDSTQTSASSVVRLLSRLTEATGCLVLLGVSVQIAFHSILYLMMGFAAVLVLGSVILAHYLMKSAIHDLSDRFHTERQALLDKAEADEWLLSILSTAVDGPMDGVIAVDTSNSVVYINRAAESLTGWRHLDAADRPLESVLVLRHETTLKTLDSPIQKVWDDGQRHKIEALTLVESQSGVCTPVDGMLLPILNENEISGAVLLLRDSSESRAARESQHTIERLKSVVVESSLDCVVLIDGHGDIVDLNPVAQRTFGSKSEVMAGKQFFTTALVPASSCSAAVEFERAVEHGKSEIIRQNTEVTALRSDGTEFVAELAITELPGQSPVIYAAYIRDISDRLAARIAERNARIAAETESRDKSIFLADMSDELRTPLNAIIGYTELLIETAAEDRLESLGPDLEKIRDAGRVLNSQIGDILDLARLESSRTNLYLERFHIQELLNDVVRTVLPDLSSNGNRLEIEIPVELGDMYSDKMKLRQGLSNLISNVSRHTHDRKLLLRVEGKSEKSIDWICFTVSDVTVGLPSVEIDRLIDAYMSGGAPSRARFGGNGLGLVIVRHFCEMLGGRAISSRHIGHGATFGMQVPATSAYR